MATVLKAHRIVNPGKHKKKRLTLLQKLHFGTTRQRAAAQQSLHKKRSNPSKLGKYKNRKVKRARTSAQQTYQRRRHDVRHKRYVDRQANVGEIITIRPLSNPGSGSKRRKNKGTKTMAKSQKRRLAGLKAARTRKRRMSLRRASAGGHRRRRTSNPGTHRRRTRTVIKYHTRSRNIGHRRRSNPGMMTGDFGRALGIIAGAMVTRFVSGILPASLNTGIIGYVSTGIIAMLQGKAVGKILKNPALGRDMTIGGFVYLSLKLIQDFMPNIGLPFSLGLVGPSSFYVPQVPVMGSMGQFQVPNAVRGYVAGAMPVAAASGMHGINTRRVGRTR